MNNRDAQSGGNRYISNKMFVGKNLGAQLIDLCLSEGSNFIGEWLFFVVGELGYLGVGVLEQVRIRGVLSEQKFCCLA